MMMTSPAITWMRVWEFYNGYRKWSCRETVNCESGVTIGNLAETLEGRNIYYGGSADGKLAGFATKFRQPHEDGSCTCSLFED